VRVLRVLARLTRVMEVIRPDLKALAHDNTIQTRALFATVEEGASRKRQRLSTEDDLERAALSVRLHAEYADVQELPALLAQKQATAVSARKKGKARSAVVDGAIAPDEQRTVKLIEGITEKSTPQGSRGSTALVQRSKAAFSTEKEDRTASQTLSVARAQATQQIRPDWHPPWKLMRVIAGRRAGQSMVCKWCW
jgi:pleiotropic regulator 1